MPLAQTTAKTQAMGSGKAAATPTAKAASAPGSPQRPFSAPPPPTPRNPYSNTFIKFVPNPITTGGDSRYPWAGEFNDPVNGAHTKTVPIKGDGSWAWTPPVGGPYDEGNVSKYDSLTDDAINSSPLGASMIKAGLDPRSMKDRYTFKAMYDPNTPASVTRQLAGAGVTNIPRHSIDDLDPRLSQGYLNNQAQKQWQNATVDSANMGNNRSLYAGAGISYHDPNIPALDSGYYQNLARQRQNAWAGVGNDQLSDPLSAARSRLPIPGYNPDRQPGRGPGPGGGPVPVPEPVPGGRPPITRGPPPTGEPPIVNPWGETLPGDPGPLPGMPGDPGPNWGGQNPGQPTNPFDPKLWGNYGPDLGAPLPKALPWYLR